MSTILTTYRVYCYDGVNQVVSADWLEAASDEAAVEKARAAGFGSKCEVWDGRRLVAKLEEERRTA